jgi:hypothetical protein
MKKWMRGVFIPGVLGILAGATISYAQTTVPDRTIDSDTGTTVQRDGVVRDGAVVEERVPRDRVVVEERVVERKRPGELYVAGFGGWTLGHSFSNTNDGGASSAQGSFDLADSVVYGMKVGYFMPGRMNWLGVELDGFNTTPHLEQRDNVPGSHLRVTTLGLNLIARKRLACRADDRDHYDRTRHTTAYEKDGRYYDDRTPVEENERCPLQVYAGAGPAIFFAETSNQFGNSSEKGEVGVNALAGLKYFVHRNVAIFGEYKFNYAGFDFQQFQSTAAAAQGITGNYKASHFVGGLAVHF